MEYYHILCETLCVCSFNSFRQCEGLKARSGNGYGSHVFFVLTNGRRSESEGTCHIYAND